MFRGRPKRWVLPVNPQAKRKKTMPSFFKRSQNTDKNTPGNVTESELTGSNVSIKSSSSSGIRNSIRQKGANLRVAVCGKRFSSKNKTADTNSSTASKSENDAIGQDGHRRGLRKQSESLSCDEILSSTSIRKPKADNHSTASHERISDLENCACNNKYFSAPEVRAVMIGGNFSGQSNAMNNTVIYDEYDTEGLCFGGGGTEKTSESKHKQSERQTQLTKSHVAHLETNLLKKVAINPPQDPHTSSRQPLKIDTTDPRTKPRANSSSNVSPERNNILEGNLTTLSNTSSKSYWQGKDTVFVVPELLADIGCEVSRVH